MEWFSIKNKLPNSTCEMWITDGHEVGVGWLRLSDFKWQAGHDYVEIIGDAWARLDITVTHWAKIELPESQE